MRRAVLRGSLTVRDKVETGDPAGQRQRQAETLSGVVEEIKQARNNGDPTPAASHPSPTPTLTRIN